MTDEELATMLNTVADEFDSRSIAGATGLRARAFEFRPKRVYIWNGVRTGPSVSHWFWNTGTREWNHIECSPILGCNIFADHKPDASLSLADLKIDYASYIPPNWNCKR